MIFYFSKTKDETVDLFKWLDENIPEWRTEEWSNQERNNDYQWKDYYSPFDSFDGKMWVAIPMFKFNKGYNIKLNIPDSKSVLFKMTWG